MQPDVVPTAESQVDVRVILSELFGESDHPPIGHEATVARCRKMSGAAVAVTRIDQGVATGGVCNTIRKIAPHRDRSQSFMQKNDHRRIDGCDSHEAIFKTMTLNRK